ncbi:MAG: hypothetical protein DVB23_000374 [Verrucomicrobia bacterium]|nr:MAG: hypothetical protein DVB23_000374 [Verrucomicrobiota bacterium]
MNPDPSLTEAASGPALALPANHGSVPDLEDDFTDEVLGERQGSACSMEPGCTSCE